MLRSRARRIMLKSAGALVATSTFPTALQATIGDAKGIDATRVGLVIGNSRYPDSPLANPANDANAIAQSLGSLGFKTQLLLDATLADLSAAIAAYVDELARQKAVGLFYYAGHGVQLGWRNYIIPIGANIDRLDDVPKQAYELNVMLTALAKAKNPMNIIILDACRDNPFGKRVLPEQKGLSQFDAPIGSLLSYATSPGNTASDGSGANGLFTENLLREMKVPLARIEDVFKRVRLNVRLKSNGAQIPWESTSLEEDFYFIANEAQFRQAERELLQTKEKVETEAVAKEKAEALARAEAEIKAQASLQKQSQEQRMQAELAVWEKALGSPTAAMTEEYLKLYPSGFYSQLALARLDTLLAKAGEKKLTVQSAVDNPFTKGSASGVSKYTVGDQFTFVLKDSMSRATFKTYTEVVTGVSDSQTVFDNGNRIIDSLGNDIDLQNTASATYPQFFPDTYTVGHAWKAYHSAFVVGAGRSIEQFQASYPSPVTIEFKIVGRDHLTTPAGQFNAFRVRGIGFTLYRRRIEITYLIDPEKCAQPISFDISVTNDRQARSRTDLTELVAFQQRALG